MNICVTNLSQETSEDSLRYAFSAFGQVRAVTIVGDKITGELKALVSMPVEREARTAISKMNGQDLHGRIVQAVGQARTNILPLREKRRVSRPGRGGPRRDGHNRAHRGRRRRS
ncbi:MAG: RNA-binding protein [Planctomycetes bacterium]|nr:RNA-binding protein [Planctomycetota bacterium]